MRSATSRSSLILGVFIATFFIAAQCFAADAYYRVPLVKLTAVEGTIPADARAEAEVFGVHPYAAADDPTIECYVAPVANGSDACVYLHATNAVPEVTGTLLVPNSDGTA